MWNQHPLFLGRRPIPQKLAEHGFAQTDEGWRFSAGLMENSLLATVAVSGNRTSVMVCDAATGEEYAPIYLAAASGVFVSAAKEELNALLDALSRNCYEPDLFRTPQSRQVVEYIALTYSVSPEHPFEKSGDGSAVFRQPHGKKWFAIMMTVEGRRIGLKTPDPVEILNLKAAPAAVERLVTQPGFFPAYHMNKIHWFTVLLDGTVDDRRLFALIDQSLAALGKPVK